MKTMVTIALVAALAGGAMGQTKKPEKGETPAKEAPAKVESSAGLKVGDKAPAFSATSFVKGKKVTELEEGKAYVVEFWATWCGPCIKNIPHLTSLQKKYKDVTIIGMASSERPSAQGGKDDRLKGVQNFVRSQGPKMNYTVAYDEPGEMRTKWMQAAGQNGIPCAFVVDTEGKIAFIGHPANAEFETKVKEVAAAAKKAAAEKRSKGKKKTDDDADSMKDEDSSSDTDDASEKASDSQKSEDSQKSKDSQKSTDSQKSKDSQKSTDSQKSKDSQKSTDSQKSKDSQKSTDSQKSKDSTKAKDPK
jgi:thiol-disulfide isomerase/thioredoxin